MQCIDCNVDDGETKKHSGRELRRGLQLVRNMQHGSWQILLVQTNTAGPNIANKYWCSQHCNGILSKSSDDRGSIDKPSRRELLMMGEGEQLLKGEIELLKGGN